MKNTVIIFVISMLLAQIPAIGQVVKGKYVEMETDTKRGENYRLMPVGEEGVLCLLLSEEFQKNNKRELIATMFDTELNVVWEKIYLVESGTDIIDHHYTRGAIDLLLEKESYKYQVLQVSLKNGASNLVEYSKVKQFYVSEFSSFGPIFFFGGEIKGTPAVMRFDSRTGNSIVCPSINQLKADLISMQVSEEHRIVSVLLKSQVNKDDISLYVNTYDLAGKLVHNYALPYSQKYNLLTFRPYVINQNELLVTGTYALKRDDSAQGVFVLKLYKNEMEDLRFYDFGYLKNFFNYLSEKKQERLVQRIERRREKEKIYPLRYNLFLHELKVNNDQLILAGDLHEPVRDATAYPVGMFWYSGWRNPYYRRMENSSFSNGGYTPASVTREPPEKAGSTYGFEILNTFACGIDMEGNLLWDNSFSHDDTEVDYPIEITNVYAHDDSVYFLQADEKELRYKVSPLRSFADTVVCDTLNYLNEDIEKITGFENGGIIDWYDNHFISSGIRYINNKFNNELDRDVFYLYKVSCYTDRRRVGE